MNKINEILRSENLDYFYETRGNKLNILSDGNFVFEKRKSYTILGHIGSGKTKTLALAAVLDFPKTEMFYIKVKRRFVNLSVATHKQMIDKVFSSRDISEGGY